ncbi:hypothetical protein SAMN05421688_1829 [Poseidonocella pacifica]|uniref:Uncharacterized protein n=1 Tax=Poseidonocella pacifica TaxID=871651 RepID=A0A1I0X3P7_9RHOB|nr:hypothetical protein SAMN05421688_1829 [Poseidonocella pacifica]
MRTKLSYAGGTSMTAIYRVLFFFNSLKVALLLPTKNALP